MSFISSKEKEPCGSESNWKHLPLKQTHPHIIMKPRELQLLFSFFSDASFLTLKGDKILLPLTNTR